MYVLCDNCHNHYDDASQSKKCAGISKNANLSGSPVSSHKVINPRPIHEHIDSVRAFRGRGRPNPRMTIEEWPSPVP